VVADALATLRADVLGSGFASVDYADLRDAETLEDLPALSGRPARLLVAARIGKARLIDNMAVG
jgi:pantoate--beta-alanine ligase